MKRHSDKRYSINRRKFLKTAGWAALTPLLPGLLSLPDRWGRSGKFRAQLLIPSSELYPDMRKNFLAGMEVCRNMYPQNELFKLEYSVHDTGMGPGKALNIARNLIQNEDIDLITGIIDPSLNPGLVSLCEEKGVMLIANNAGANIQDRHSDNSYLIQNSMQYWETNLAMGRWTAQNLGRRAIVAASFYESGYDALYAFSHGFEAGGGKVLETVISNKPDAPDVSMVPIRTIRQYKPDFVFASYSGPEAVEFIRLYADSGLSSNIPLVTSGFMVDEYNLQRLDPESLGIRSCHSWAPGLANDANQILNRYFRNRYGCPPDVFAVMGFETAMLIDTVLKRKSITAEFSASLPTDTINGPRGLIRHSNSLLEPETPIYMRQVKRVNGRLQNVVIAELKNTVTSSERYHLAASGPKTGWLNTYLCV